jgi:His-Xaa-Ser system radical SAM maturase HxsC
MNRIHKASHVVSKNDYYVGKVIKIDDDSKNRIYLINPAGEGFVISSDIVDSSDFAIIDMNTARNIKLADVIEIKKNGRIEIHYGNDRNDNSLFITANCNCNCLSCPQIVTKRDDYEYLYLKNLQIIGNLDDTCKVIGLTGGEPLLAGDYLFSTLTAINEKLPNTVVQILTNGILLGSKPYFKRIAPFINNKYVFEIPIYSDFPDDHDLFLNHKGGFYQSIDGMYSLAMTKCAIEVRILLSSITIKRLKQLSVFIFKNLPFVNHVALMGIEVIGNAVHNWSRLRIDLKKHSNILEESIDYLSRWNIPVSLYNIPLCNLSPELHKYAADSISVWKKHFQEECNFCTLKEKCGGLFSTSRFSIYEINPYQ